jgi:hypothetical protein
MFPRHAGGTDRSHWSGASSRCGLFAQESRGAVAKLKGALSETNAPRDGPQQDSARAIFLMVGDAPFVQ